MPGEPVDGVKATLERVLADDQIAVKQIDQATLSAPSALREEDHRADHEIVGRILSRRGGAADDERRRNRRQPTFATPASRPTDIPGWPATSAKSRAHGRDERVLVKSFFAGSEYLYRLVKLLAGGQ